VRVASHFISDFDAGGGQRPEYGERRWSQAHPNARSACRHKTLRNPNPTVMARLSVAQWPPSLNENDALLVAGGRFAAQESGYVSMF
jgi:hypothetical protein